MLFSVQEEILRYFLSVSPPPSVENEAQTSSLSLSLSLPDQIQARVPSSAGRM